MVITNAFRFFIGFGGACLFYGAYFRIHSNDLFSRVVIILCSIGNVVWTLSQKIIIVRFSYSDRTLVKRAYSLFEIFNPQESIYRLPQIEALIFLRTVRSTPNGSVQQFSILIKDQHCELQIFDQVELPLFARDFANRLARKLNTTVEERTLQLP